MRFFEHGNFFRRKFPPLPRGKGFVQRYRPNGKAVQPIYPRAVHAEHPLDLVIHALPQLHKGKARIRRANRLPAFGPLHPGGQCRAHLNARRRCLQARRAQGRAVGGGPYGLASISGDVQAVVLAGRGRFRPPGPGPPGAPPGAR